MSKKELLKRDIKAAELAVTWHINAAPIYLMLLMLVSKFLVFVPILYSAVLYIKYRNAKKRNKEDIKDPAFKDPLQFKDYSLL